MTAPILPQTEWRVCAEAIDGEWLGWRVRVYVRPVKQGEEPGQWRLVRDVTYTCPKGQVKRDYWKAILREAAR